MAILTRRARRYVHSADPAARFRAERPADDDAQLVPVEDCESIDGCDVFVCSPLSRTAVLGKFQLDKEAILAFTKLEWLEHMLAVITQAVTIETADGRRLSGIDARDAIDLDSDQGSLGVLLYTCVTSLTRPGGADAVRFRSAS